MLVALAVVFLEGGRVLVMGAASGTRAVEVATGRVLWDGAPAHVLAVSSDGKTLAAMEATYEMTPAGIESRVSLREAATGRETRSLVLASYPAQTLRFSEDGAFVAVGNGERELLISTRGASVNGGVPVPSEDMHLVNEVPRPPDQIVAYAVSPQRIAIELASGALVVRDRKKRTERVFNDRAFGGAWSSLQLARMAFLPDGRTLIIAGTPVRRFDSETGKWLAPLALAHPRVVVAKDGNVAGYGGSAVTQVLRVGK